MNKIFFIIREFPPQKITGIFTFMKINCSTKYCGILVSSPVASVRFHVAFLSPSRIQNSMQICPPKSILIRHLQ